MYVHSTVLVSFFYLYMHFYFILCSLIVSFLLSFLSVFYSDGGNVQFNTININANTCWFDSVSSEDIIELQQLEKDTIFVATPRILLLIKSPLICLEIHRLNISYLIISDTHVHV